MSKIDQKLIYNLLARADILKYLNIYDKTMLSSCCKYIYVKCSVIRQENLKFKDKEFQEYIDNSQKGKRWGYDDYELESEYFDAIVNKHKSHTLRLIYSAKEYFLIEYFSLKFTNLTSLCLYNIILPKNILKSIIKNLSNLQSLVLCCIVACYSKNDIQVTDFKFSKQLRKLVWTDCIQFEVDSTDYSYIKQYLVDLYYENGSILDLSLNLVNTLKHIEWQHMITDGTQVFNEAISNNPGLTSLRVALSCLNSDGFKLISSSNNLSKLLITMYYEFFELDSATLCKLPNIKTLEFYTTIDYVFNSVNLLTSFCPNLEDLMLSYYEGLDQNMIDYLKNFPNLKILTIKLYHISTSTLGSILPKSNLEKLVIHSSDPLKFNFNIFINMKKLKYINNIHDFYQYNNYIKPPEYEDLKDWKMIVYPKSTNYWKK